jgi:HEPN domain-containing protein
LIIILRQNSIELPEKILDAAILTQYAVATRYPDVTAKISQDDYEEALKIAKNVYNWVEKQINL